jgi:hypothetical protein
MAVGDLRLEIGLPLRDPGDKINETEFASAMEKATKVSKDSGIPLLGIAVGPEMIKQRIDQGFRVIASCLDVHTLAMGMIRTIEEAKQTAEAHLRSKSST